MWAQGLTIGVLIAAGVLTQSSRQASHDNRSVDHSWANILAEQEKEERENAQFRELARAQEAVAFRVEDTGISTGLAATPLAATLRAGR